MIYRGWPWEKEKKTPQHRSEAQKAKSTQDTDIAVSNRDGRARDGNDSMDPRIKS
jgi:hypothetical protein